MTTKNIKNFFILTICFFILFITFTLATGQSYAEEIYTAPYLLAVEGEGNIVLHTNIPYGCVCNDSYNCSDLLLTINENIIEVKRCVMDSRGYLDIHFPKSEVLDPDACSYEFVLSGYSICGEQDHEFIASQIVIAPPNNK